ncbi:MAG: c-type cytochrome [Nitrospinales bacterium]
MTRFKIALVLLPMAALAGVGLASASELETGKKIFLKRCKVCHGERGQSDSFAASVLNPPPRNFTAPESKVELTEDRMIHSVTHGRPGTAMMPWEVNLTAAEIRAVVHYIRRVLMGLED